MSFVYDKMGRLTQRTSFEGVTTNYTYDHRGRVTEVYDSVGTFIAYTYDSMGKVLTVEDGEGNVTSYDYDSQFRLVKVTDDEGKQVHYTYDADGRVTQVGAGSTGTFDRTVYTYNGTTGLLSQVTYYSGGSSHSANYHYDDAARVVKLTDWIDGTDGIQYEYDALGRLEVVRDYDGSELSYAYDEVGNIASMTDYHDNTINYTYTARDQLYTLTAPGSKVWTYTYNALGQPTRVDIPNGMHTEYAYDTRNRLTEIAHKDGSTVKQSFGYALDDDGTITTITHEDGSHWDYDYDGRNRLIAADRKSASGNIVAKYAYTYDNADNMLTKTEPFEDDFGDNNYSGWSVWGGSWSAADGYLKKTAAGNGAIARNTTDANGEVRLDYRVTNTSTSDWGILRLRSIAPDDFLYVEIKPTQLRLIKKIGAVWTVLDTASISTTQDQWYTLRAEYDGANVTVWRSTEGELETELLTTTAAAPTTTSSVMLGISSGGTTGNTFEFDKVRILADDLENNFTFAYNTANELTSMAGPNGTTTFTYDAWGRQTAKTLNGVTDTYGWRYHGMLYAVDVGNDSSVDVSYEYGGDQKRRSRSTNDNFTWFKWSGWNVIADENANGDVVRWYLPFLADTEGQPAIASIRYYASDHIQSIREVYGPTRAIEARQEFDPYGTAISIEGAELNHGHSAKRYDKVSGMAYSMFRYSSTNITRWLSRDPLGGVESPNVYSFLAANPIQNSDPDGQCPGFVDRMVPMGGEGGGRPNRWNCYANVSDLLNMDYGDAWGVVSQRCSPGGQWDYYYQYCGSQPPAVLINPREMEDLGNFNFGACLWALGISNWVGIGYSGIGNLFNNGFDNWGNELNRDWPLIFEGWYWANDQFEGCNIPRRLREKTPPPLFMFD